jgi:hypothetical protein
LLVSYKESYLRVVSNKEFSLSLPPWSPPLFPVSLIASSLVPAAPPRAPPKFVGSPHRCAVRRIYPLASLPQIPSTLGRHFHLRHLCSMSDLTTSPRVARAGRRCHGSPAPQLLIRCYKRSSSLLRRAIHPATNRPVALLQTVV